MRRERQVHEGIKEEQQLAKLPLSQVSVHTAAQKNVQENYDEIIVTNSKNSSQDSDAVNSDLKNNLVFVLKKNQEQYRKRSDGRQSAAGIYREGKISIHIR